MRIFLNEQNEGHSAAQSSRKFVNFELVYYFVKMNSMFVHFFFTFSGFPVPYEKMLIFLSWNV